MNTNDNGPGSLRRAIGYGGTITFDPGLDGDTIELTSGPLVAYLYDVIIDASELGNGIRISGLSASRVFEVDEGIDVKMINLTISDGYALQGAGIFNNGGAVTLENCTVENNLTTGTGGPGDLLTGDGGGILNGALQLSNGVVVRSDVKSRLTLNNSTVRNNTAEYGGGIANIGGDIWVRNSTISGNEARMGGGILNTAGISASKDKPRNGHVELVNATVADNTQGILELNLEGRPQGAGGIVNQNNSYTQIFDIESFDCQGEIEPDGYDSCTPANSIDVVHSTVASNIITYPGGDPKNSAGIFHDPGRIGKPTNGYVRLVNSIIADNYNGAVNVDLIGSFTIQGNNLVTKRGDATFHNNGHEFTYPFEWTFFFKPLKNYGGDTETRPTLLGSAAGVFPGDNDFAPSHDQRGVTRPRGRNVDIGAVELITFADALDTDVLTAISSLHDPGDLGASWFGQSTTKCPWPECAVDNDDALQSGHIGVGRLSILNASVTGPGRLSFWWKISGDFSDRLEFFLDGGIYDAIVEEVDWQQFSIDIPAGDHQLGWWFDAGSGTPGGAGWVDEVVFQPQVQVTNCLLYTSPSPRDSYADRV